MGSRIKARPATRRLADDAESGIYMYAIVPTGCCSACLPDRFGCPGTSPVGNLTALCHVRVRATPIL